MTARTIILLVLVATTGCATLSPAQREAQCAYARDSREVVVYDNGNGYTAIERPQGGLFGRMAVESVCSE